MAQRRGLLTIVVVRGSATVLKSPAHTIISVHQADEREQEEWGGDYGTVDSLDAVDALHVLHVVGVDGGETPLLGLVRLPLGRVRVQTLGNDRLRRY